MSTVAVYRVLCIEDDVVEVHPSDGVVELGLGSVAYVHPGAVVDVTGGAVAHLASGAQLLEDRPGALERADYTVTPWVDYPHSPLCRSVPPQEAQS